MSKSLTEILAQNQRDPGDLPHLSASSLALHMRCPRQWQQSYILGEKGEPSDALVIGLAVHLCLERLLAGEEMGDWWNDSVPDGFEPDPSSKGVAEAMVYHYWEQMGKFLLPNIVETEKQFYVDVPGVGLPILGYIDIETDTTLIDLKTTRYFQRSRVRPNKEWVFQQGIYQLAVDKPSEVHVLTRAKTDPIVIPDNTSHPLHFGRIDSTKITEMIQYEWSKILFNWDFYGAEKPWPGNPMHEWAGKYCGVDNCCAL